MTASSEDSDARAEWLEAQGEAAYERLYDAHDATSVAACYNDAKEFFSDAIGMRRRMGDADSVARLDARLAHIKAVYRSQFS